MGDRPKGTNEIIAALRAERAVIASRLDAIDLALDNLQRVWPETERTPKQRRQRVVGDDSAAAQRRDQLLAVIQKAPMGVTGSELRKLTPKMDPKDRANALSVMKAKKQIKRAGNTWTVAA